MAEKRGNFLNEDIEFTYKVSMLRQQIFRYDVSILGILKKRDGTDMSVELTKKQIKE